jgi:outer membrane protein assembly factor BamB
LVAGGATAVLAAACSSPSPARGHAVPAGWTRTDLNPVTQPAPVAGRFVLYASSGRQISVLGLNARTGATVWSDPTTPSIMATGVVPNLAVVGGVVIYLHRLGGQTADLVGADAATGRTIWHSGAGHFTGWPQVCPGSAADVCVTGALGASADPGTLLRFDGRTGARLPAVLISISFLAFGLAPGLYADTANPQSFVAVSGRAIDWARQLTDLFTLPGATTNTGWNLDRAVHAGLFVGSVGFPPVSAGTTQATFDLSHSMTAGFRIADGSVVWRDNGSTYACNFDPLPCPGADLAGYSSAASTAGPTVGLRLRSTGTVTYTRRAPLQPLASPDEHTVIEGFAPATGRTLWTFDAGHDPGFLAPTAPPAQVAAYTVVLTAPDGRFVALNLASGSTRPMPGAAIAWCRPLLTYNTDNQEYIGQYGISPCNDQQHAVPTPTRVPSFVSAIGASADDLVAWSEPSAVVAAPPGG